MLACEGQQGDWGLDKAASDTDTRPQLHSLHKRGVRSCLWYHCPELSPKTRGKFYP